jgi:hypothetical protein
MNPTMFREWAKRYAANGGVTKSNVGLGNCDNTSDVNKPVSTAQQTAIDAKVSDTAYGAGWNGDTTVAPSKNAVYDKVEAVIAAAQPLDADLTALAAISGVEGDIIYHNGTSWTRLAKGTAGQVLTMNGGATAPEWV